MFTLVFLLVLTVLPPIPGEGFAGCVVSHFGQKALNGIMSYLKHLNYYNAFKTMSEVMSLGKSSENTTFSDVIGGGPEA